MVNKEDLERLVKYQSSVKIRLDEKMVPEKHKDSEKQYRAFLQKEYSITTKKINDLKISVTDKK